MTESRYPKGWDAERVKQLIEAEEQLTEDEQVAEDEVGDSKNSGQVVLTVPEALLPEIRRLVADHEEAR